MDYNKWDGVGSDSDDDKPPSSVWDTNPARLAAAKIREDGGGPTISQQAEMQRLLPRGVRVACEQCDEALARHPHCGEEELRLLLDQVCRPGFAERWFSAGPMSTQPTAKGAIPEWLRLFGLLEGHWLEGASSVGAEIPPAVRRLTDFASQPLTALAALLLCGVAELDRDGALVLHVVGATNAAGKRMYCAVGCPRLSGAVYSVMRLKILLTIWRMLQGGTRASAGMRSGDCCRPCCQATAS